MYSDISDNVLSKFPSFFLSEYLKFRVHEEIILPVLLCWCYDCTVLKLELLF
jgi:hypothetical protein